VPTLAKPKATVAIQARVLEALKVPAKAWPAVTTTVLKKPWVGGLSSLPLARWNETCTFRYIPVGMPFTTEPVVTVGVRLDTKPSLLDYTVPPTEKPSGTEESQERNTELQSLPSTWLPVVGAARRVLSVILL
jgi:hypothetical protein